MISYIKGIILKINEDNICINTGNIGYKVFVNESTILKFIEGDEVELYTYQSFSDHGSSLFGFLDNVSLNFFEKIIQVSGIGPKLGMIILGCPLDTLKHAISNNDIALLIEFPGIGRKTAERLCLELKNKVDKITLNLSKSIEPGTNTLHTNAAHSTPLCNEEAFSALQSLGYSRLEAHRMISKVSATFFKTEDIVKEALKKIKD